ncbi:Smf family DNA processing protein [Niallia circulans]|nr:DNA-protecting protein DprA [Shouchella clausii]SPU22160.1 Smf family DNA processing protein [Niallia circulans]
MKKASPTKPQNNGMAFSPLPRCKGLFKVWQSFPLERLNNVMRPIQYRKELSLISFVRRYVHVHTWLYGHYRAFSKLLCWDPTLQAPYHASPVEIAAKLGINEKSATAFWRHLHKTTPENMYANLIKTGIQVLPLFHPLYPPLLKTIYDPPYLLYAKGNIKLLQTKKIAICGTRTPTAYGRAALATIAKPISEHSLTIVSGMARGIDGLAHEQAIRTGGATIAVLGSGFDNIYPPEHSTLFHALAEHQLLLSEYPPFVKPQRWHFPVRNRIISGLSQAVIIIEAKRKSGSLITADLALEQGRDVFAVPGPVTSAQSEGTNWLISQGAGCLYASESLFEAMPQLLSKTGESPSF